MLLRPCNHFGDLRRAHFTGNAQLCSAKADDLEGVTSVGIAKNNSYVIDKNVFLCYLAEMRMSQTACVQAVSGGDLRHDGFGPRRQRKTAENSEGAANIFAVLLLVGSSVSQDFCGMQGIDG